MWLGRDISNCNENITRGGNPLVKDHRKSKSPYFSRYGETLVNKLKNYYFMSKLCCINDLIRFMVT